MTEATHWTDAERRHVALALGRARDRILEVDPDPRGPDIVFEVIKTMSDVHRRMRVRDNGPKRLRAMRFDYLHTLSEREEALKQRKIDLAAGDDPGALFGLNLQPDPQDIAIADAVSSVFRSCLIGDRPERDWKILHLLATGLTARRVGRVIGSSHARVADRKIVQCGAIWRRVQNLVPAVVLPVEPVVWWQREAA